jgi:hypothetical protein
MTKNANLLPKKLLDTKGTRPCPYDLWFSAVS